MHDDIALFRSDSELRQLVQSFESCTLPHECWTHRAHVSVGAWYTLRHGEGAIDRIRAGILALNKSHGVETTPTRGYHETITVAWSRLIADQLGKIDPNVPDHEKVNSVANALSDKTRLLEYYNRNTLMSHDARYGWVEPDIKPLPTSSVAVRPAEERDLEAILEIVNREIAEGYAHFGLQPMEYRSLLGEWREMQRNYPWLVAESDGKVVGYAKASPWKSRGAYRWTTEIGVYVRPSHHRQGIGRQLYAALFPALEAAGFRTVMAGIALPNDASVRLHEAFGMKQVAHMPAVGYKFGEWRDVAYWSIRIGDPNLPPHP